MNWSGGWVDTGKASVKDTVDCGSIPERVKLKTKNWYLQFFFSMFTIKKGTV